VGQEPTRTGTKEELANSQEPARNLPKTNQGPARNRPGANFSGKARVLKDSLLCFGHWHMDSTGASLDVYPGDWSFERGINS